MNGTHSPKERYRNLCAREPTIPLFSKDWWLDAVGPGHWDVVLVQNGDRVAASLPYHMDRRMGITSLRMPPLTQTLGPWIDYPADQKTTTRLGYEKEVLEQLIQGLPGFQWFHQKFHHTITNWLPFYWAGFRQTTRYTSILESILDLERVYAGFRENIRREIKKAENRVSVSEEKDLSLFQEVMTKTFDRQGKKVPFSLDLLERIDAACRAHQAGTMLFARDERNVHAVLYLVWDSAAAYYWMGGGDPELRNSGAASLLLWEAIRLAAARGIPSFDFEGSMLEPVERYFRAFGGVQKPYFSVWKGKGLMRLATCIKS